MSTASIGRLSTILLHEVHRNIAALRNRHGLAPCDDGIERDSVFHRPPALVFRTSGATRGAARIDQ